MAPRSFIPTRDVVAEHSREARARAQFEHRCEALREKLGQEDFLQNKGIGNEVGFFTFCYDPALELEARAFFAQLEQESRAGKLPCNLMVRNLYDVFLRMCEKKRILRAIPAQELKRGSAYQLKQLQKICSPEAFAAELEYEPHRPGDVLLLTGVGEVYPFLRVHALLNNMHAQFGDIPVVTAYPGTFNGQTFSLFNSLSDGNYYRAFNID